MIYAWAERPGLAYRIVGDHLDETYYWDYDLECEVPVMEPTGLVVVVAVGDNRRMTADPDDLTPTDCCPCCGSTDCEWR